MKTETLTFANALDEASAVEAARVLNAIKGVHKAAITTKTASIEISFDEDVTSLQEVRFALQNAGIGVKRAAHGAEGMCCGSCGS